GQSEGRQYFPENYDDVNRRALATLSHGMNPIICVGELLPEREEGRTHEVVRRQLKAALVDFTPELALKSVIAYEPVWAIGTGKVATPDEAQDVHRMIREVLAELLGEDAAAKIRLQYGGSVSPDNAAGLFAQPDIDGALVGGASLQVEKFAAIVKAACRSA
ncbi:triosephosphate isomerase, partial [Candidatus Sumerlaeota bacterium]|nr:triosephosphate isomerase [Candidatus Sumerlaeota bacterium]